MEEKFLVGTKLIGNIDVGFALDKRVSIPAKSILKIEEGINTSCCQSIIEKCNNEWQIIDSIKRQPYLGTYVYYKDPSYEKSQIILFVEDFDECMSQLKSKKV